jgi:dienelactone hydrolase
MDLDGFTRTSFTHDLQTRPVYRRGEGPAVVVIHEIPGIIPEVARFATRVADAGFSVYMPSLFGTPGRPFTMPYATAEVLACCVSREFRVLASREASPITDWLRALARQAHAETGGRGVGAIGMCLTGNFALTLAMDEAVLAPVLSQPSLPFPVSRRLRGGLHLSDEGLASLKKRAAGGLKVLGLRFTRDPACPAERFTRLREEIGPAFEAIEIDSSSGNPAGIPSSAHSVVTKDLVDREGHPTREALDRVIGFFRQQLGSSTTAEMSPIPA